MILNIEFPSLIQSRMFHFIVHIYATCHAFRCDLKYFKHMHVCIDAVYKINKII